MREDNEERLEKRMSMGQAVKDIAYRVRELEEEKMKKKKWKIPFRWKFRFITSRRKYHHNDILVMVFNKKNEIEPPQFMEIRSGNLIIYKDKPYHFTPKAIWKLRSLGYPSIYCIKETDMRPISNMDADEVKRSGYSTDAAELLLKEFLTAKTTKLPIKTNTIVGIVVVLIIIGGIIWWLSSGSSPVPTPPVG